MAVYAAPTVEALRLNQKAMRIGNAELRGFLGVAVVIAGFATNMHDDGRATIFRMTCLGDILPIRYAC